MRLLIRHEVSFRFEPAARFVNGVVRLTPRNHEGQFLANWRLALDVDGRLKPGDDALGNIIHGMALTGPLGALTLRVEGEIGTFDTIGVMRGTLERFPPEFFLRETALTMPSAKLRSYAEQVSGGGEPLARLHNILDALHGDLGWERGTQADPSATNAGRVLANGKGDAADLAHVFIACAHHLAIPARFACGYYYFSDEGPISIQALHCWAEAHVAGLGWVGFDPAGGHCPNDAYVRLSCGLDSNGAMPIRIAATGPEQTTRVDTIQIAQPSR